MIARIENICMMSSKTRRWSITLYSVLSFVLIAIYVAILLELAESKNLLPDTGLNSDIYIYGLSMFLGLIGAVILPLTTLMLGFITKCFSVQWLKNGEPEYKNYLSVLVVSFQEYILVGVSLLILALVFTATGVVGSWFIKLNYSIFLAGLIFYPLVALKKLLGISGWRSIVSYSIAILIVAIMLTVFASTR